MCIQYVRVLHAWVGACVVRVCLCVCVCVYASVVGWVGVHVTFTFALRQLSGPLSSCLARSALTPLQLVARIAGVIHLSTKVLVRQLSLSIGGGAWITTGHNCKQDRGKCILYGGGKRYISFAVHHNSAQQMD